LRVLTSVQGLEDCLERYRKENLWRPLKDIILQKSAPGWLGNDPWLIPPSNRQDFGERVSRVLKFDIHEVIGKRREFRAYKRVYFPKFRRIEVVQRIFDVFVDRSLAYGLRHCLGLITFSSAPSIIQSLTNVDEDFRHSLTKVRCGGFTSVWDALWIAHSRILDRAGLYPGVQKRIICLSDGEDTSSSHTAQQVCLALQENCIVLDTVMIGRADNRDLRTISYATNGYKFSPTNFDTARSICELETFLSLSERPSSSPKPPARLEAKFAELSRQCEPVDVISIDSVPPPRAHPRSKDVFIELAAAMDVSSRKTPADTPRRVTRQGTARILDEMRNVMVNPHGFYDVFVSEANMTFWKVVMEGPSDSSYAGGVFLLYLDADPSIYPMSAPKVRMLTPILHPNISKQGRICHSILDRNWTSDTTMRDILNSIWSLLLTPDMEDPANVIIAEKYYSDANSFKSMVKEHIRKHATKSRKSLGEEVSKFTVREVLQ